MVENLDYDWENPPKLEDEEKGLAKLIRCVSITKEALGLEFYSKDSDVYKELSRLSLISDSGLTDTEVYETLATIYDLVVEITMQTEGEEQMKNYRRVIMLDGLLEGLEIVGVEDKISEKVRYFSKKIIERNEK